MSFIKRLYISYYFYSKKINGENAFHNCYACLALTFLQLMIFCNIGVLIYFISGFSLVEAGFIDTKILPMSVLAGVFFVNYGFFTIGKRFKTLVESVSNKEAFRLRFYGLKIFIASCVTFLLLVIALSNTR